MALQPVSFPDLLGKIARLQVRSICRNPLTIKVALSIARTVSSPSSELIPL